MPINVILCDLTPITRVSAALLIIMSIAMPTSASDRAGNNTDSNTLDHAFKKTINNQYSLSSLKKRLRSQKNVPFKTTNPERYQLAKRLFSLLLKPASYSIKSNSIKSNSTESNSTTSTESMDSIVTSSSFNLLLKQADLCSKWVNVKHLKQEHKVLLIMESSENASGQGAYLFNPTGSLQFILQAPHQYFDLSSADIALQIFLENNLRAVAVNTVHRNQTDQSDLAHQEHSLYSAFTEAVAEVRFEEISPLLVQFHGFSNNNRLSDEGKEADIILSNGSRTPSFLLPKSHHWLNTNTSFKTYLYGVDINELGGTTNSSLEVMKKNNQQHLFIHVELSSVTRKKLKASRSKREQLWSSFQQ